MEYAKIFVDTVFRLHGLPEVIISDDDPPFTSKFWESLFDLLSTNLRFSTTYHPHTDGQSKSAQFVARRKDSLHRRYAQFCSTGNREEDKTRNPYNAHSTDHIQQGKAPMAMSQCI